MAFGIDRHGADGVLTRCRRQPLDVDFGKPRSSARGTAEKYVVGNELDVVDALHTRSMGQNRLFFHTYVASIERLIDPRIWSRTRTSTPYQPHGKEQSDDVSDIDPFHDITLLRQIVEGSSRKRSLTAAMWRTL